MQDLWNAIAQLIVCLILVTFFWAIHLLFSAWRKTEPESWKNWLGLYLPPLWHRRLWMFPAAFLFAWLISFLQFAIIDDFATFASRTVAWEVTRQAGIDLLIGAIAYPFVTSALTEEIFFRGFIAKRLIRHLGFQIGNLFQTLIFLAPHILLVVLFADEPNVLLFASLILTVAPIAWLAGWMMCRLDDGSIILSPWLIHSGMNFGTMIYFWLWVASVATST